LLFFVATTVCMFCIQKGGRDLVSSDVMLQGGSILCFCITVFVLVLMPTLATQV